MVSGGNNTSEHIRAPAQELPKQVLKRDVLIPVPYLQISISLFCIFCTSFSLATGYDHMASLLFSSVSSPPCSEHIITFIRHFNIISDLAWQRKTSCVFAFFSLIILIFLGSNHRNFFLCLSSSLKQKFMDLPTTPPPLHLNKVVVLKEETNLSVRDVSDSVLLLQSSLKQAFNTDIY